MRHGYTLATLEVERKTKNTEILRVFGHTNMAVGLMPNDSAVCSASVLAGSPLLEIAPKSSLRSEIRSLTGIKSTDIPKKRATRRFSRNARTQDVKTG